ncbi:hypothetical protein BDV24DRAFT_158334 [Aspergillus arachidicola]|uniref:Uncharacterized protein n=1 Tax=Aspergillus arachidicola TaxID=656916 RepID=A0A5N6YMH7_9EURO|nr:hypothetical protein BDV24DRAFT_158334 [Aspergillus arachidicola]
MKIQTLFSLATVGLAFANPVANLEARDDYTNCVISSVKDQFSEACLNLPVCRALPEFVNCMENGVQELFGFTAISNFAKLLNDCGKKAQQYLTADEFSQLSEVLPQLVEQGKAQCSQSSA